MITSENTLTSLPFANSQLEQPAATRPQRRVTAGRLVSASAGVLLLAACGNSAQTPSTHQGEGSPATSAPGGAASTAPTTSPAKLLSWPGAAPESVPYPGRVALPNSTCRVWDVNNPQPSFVRGGKLFAIIDARRSIPPQCDYRLDSGAGAYDGASYRANVRQQPEGNGFVPDGTVVQVSAYSVGQRACNDGGTSPLWIGYQRDSGGETDWSPVINLGGGPSEQVLQQNHIPELSSPYAGTVNGNC